MGNGHAGQGGGITCRAPLVGGFGLGQSLLFGNRDETVYRRVVLLDAIQKMLRQLLAGHVTCRQCIGQGFQGLAMHELVT